MMEIRPSLHTVVTALVVVCLLVFAVLLVRTAWVCDDAYITFRTVENFVRGDGLRWNVDERVQVYTHPLWLLAMIGARELTGEVYFSSLALSIALSLGAVLVVVLLIADSTTAALAAAMLAVPSRAFVDFSTSGLENALSHLLVALFFAACWRWRPANGSRLAAIAGLAALALVNRLDLGLLLLPVVVAIYFEAPGWRRAALVGAGLAPIVLWEAFSLVYYGFLFPNTAYAKLATGIPAQDLAVQGFAYLRDSLTADPLTLSVIAFAVVAGFLAKGWRGRAASVGILLYLVYVGRVGGDFMTGRFLTPAFMVAVCLIAALPFDRLRPALRAAPLVAVALVACLWPAWLTAALGRPASGSPDHAAGIADERAWYYPVTGLMRTGGAWTTPTPVQASIAEAMRAAGQRVAVRDMVGFFGFAARGDIHIVDSLGLGDPLLARLPAERPWRIGHFRRRLPDGYVESLKTGQDLVRDRWLAYYYARLHAITAGPIWGRARLLTIVRMNLGVYDGHIERYARTLEPAP